MSILNHINQLISAAIKVEVKAPVFKSGKTKYPVLVTDTSKSFTNGWFVQYNPVAQENGTRLYDGSETFSELHIARFSELKSFVETANHYFVQGVQVENVGGGRKRAIYEASPAVRLTVVSQKNSNSVTVTITDETSPFYMMSINFTVTPNQNGQGYYVVGTDNERWDRNTDVFKEYSANFAPRKGRFYRVQQAQNQPATLRAKIAVNNGQYAINHDGTFQIDTKASSPEYIQVISNEYKALAYIYEQSLMKKAFEMAISQGLPVTQQQSQQPSHQAPSTSGFNPAFGIPGAGAPNPAAPSFSSPPQPESTQQTQVPEQQQQWQQSQTPPAPGEFQLPPGVTSDDLPWTQGEN